MIEPGRFEPGRSSGRGRGTGFEEEPGTAQTTGRYVVVFTETEPDHARLLRSVTGLSTVADSRDFEDQSLDMSETAQAEATVFSELGLAVASLSDDQLAVLQTSAEARGAVLAVAPELVHHVLPVGGDYVRGYRDGVSDLQRRIADGAAADGLAAPEAGADFADDDQATWGLQATRATTSSLSGRGVKVAVLDTGMDGTHPDFTGRPVTARSFVDGETPQDGHGHGTHCIGTACGPKDPDGSRRYGVAYEAEIFAGKVLGSDGSGTDAGILAGINWAVANGCAVISMSLGADVARPHPPYTLAGRRALARGSLVIAAAGNNADRPADPGFVGAPANSPSIAAVAAVDPRLQIAEFSARSLPSRGGQVDLAGPGVEVYSSWPMPQRYRTISGTSMATPHASGVAALLAEAWGHRGLELWADLTRESRRLLLPSVDVGSGLVQAAR
jgi:subtilisin family serine protease